MRQIVPGVRMRVQAQGPADHDVDLPEDVVRGLWSDVVKPGSYFADLELRICEALAKVDGASI